MVEKKEQDQINDREIDFRIFMSETILYRKQQSDKLDALSKDLKIITDKLNLLPCRERASFYTSISEQLKVLWVFVTALVLTVFGSLIKFLIDK